jgi:hypothetical protein
MHPASNAVAILVTALLFAPGLRADDADPARPLFQKGVAAFQSGDYAGALEQFRAADAARHSPSITYNIARALEKLERPQAAVNAYEAFLGEVGAGGELTSAATLAIAQIKAKSTRLRIESTPPGATVTLDGETLTDRTPVTVLVTRGPHELVLTSGNWREARSYDAPGGGGTGELVFVHTEATRPPAAAPAPRPRPRARPRPPEIDGLMGSAGLSLSVYRFIGAPEKNDGTSQTTADSAPTGLVFGLAFDFGYALSTKTALLLRGFGGLGSSENTLASLGALAPVISWRASRRWWLGAGVAVGAGSADSDASRRDLLGAQSDASIAFQTAFALGPCLELSFVIDQNEGGHWIASLLPTTLFSLGGGQSTLFLPLMAGYRWF